MLKPPSRTELEIPAASATTDATAMRERVGIAAFCPYLIAREITIRWISLVPS